MLPSQHAYILTWEFYPHILVHHLFYIFIKLNYNGKMISSQTNIVCIPCTVHCKIRYNKRKICSSCLCVETSGILVILPSFSIHKLETTIFSTSLLQVIDVHPFSQKGAWALKSPTIT